MRIKLLNKGNSAWLLLGGAVALAALMSFGVFRYLQDRERLLQEQVVERARGGPKVSVVVPMRDVPAGTIVAKDVFVSRPIDADLVYPDMVKVADFDGFISRKTLHGILRGRPLRIGDVEALDRSLATSIPDGYRAITVSADSTNSLANMIRPGDLVDLYLLATPDADNATRGGSKGDVAALLLQKVRVLAAGRHVYDKDEREVVRSSSDDPQAATTATEYDTLTLQTTPGQAARIALAQKIGTLRAVLRGDTDPAIVPPSILGADELFPGDRPNGTRLRSVQYIVGGQGNTGVTEKSMTPALTNAIARVNANAVANAVGAPIAPTAQAAPAATAPSFVVSPGAKPTADASHSSLFFPSTGDATRR